MMTVTHRYIALAIVLIAIVGAIVLLNDARTGIAGEAEIELDDIRHAGMADARGVDMDMMGRESLADKEEKYARAREIVAPAGFINTVNNEPIEIADFIGEKVILVDFWTYSCINCQRTQPYLNAWHKKYADDGLLILGIHTPEFAFEEDYDNVLAASREAGIQYPVVLDNDYRTWAAYQNRYWPRKYLIDIDGFIVYDHIGEGAYEETEMVIQRLLAERASALGENVEISQEVAQPSDVEFVDRTKQRTREIYFGAKRNESTFGHGDASTTGEQTFTHPGTFYGDRLYLGGTWNVQEEFARSVSNARIVLSFRSQKVFMVARSEQGARLRVLLDGEAIGADAGVHVGAGGILEIQNEQLYRVVESDRYGEHILEIVVEEGVIDAFSFTFG